LDGKIKVADDGCYEFKEGGVSRREPHYHNLSEADRDAVKLEKDFFDDGLRPTNLRYGVNSAALRLIG
jgi:hypothetical protein